MLGNGGIGFGFQVDDLLRELSVNDRLIRISDLVVTDREEPVGTDEMRRLRNGDFQRLDRPFVPAHAGQRHAQREMRAREIMHQSDRAQEQVRRVLISILMKCDDGQSVVRLR